MIHKKKKCKEKGCDRETYGTLCNYHKGKKAEARKRSRPKPTGKSKKSKSTKTSIFLKHYDDIFSIETRLRDSDEIGYGKCITCPRICFFYNDCAQNGHFRRRDRRSTRYHRKNNNLQCSSCNGRGKGMEYEHGIAIDEKFGKNTAAELELISKETLHMGKLEYMEGIKECITNCEAYLKEKKFDIGLINHLKDKIEFYRRFVKREEHKVVCQES